MLHKALIGALAAAFLGGIVLLIRHPIRGIRRTATKRSVIICTAIHGVIGLFFTVMGCLYFTTLSVYLFIGLGMAGLAFALVMRNFINKPDQTDTTDAGSEGSESEIR